MNTFNHTLHRYRDIKGHTNCDVTSKSRTFSKTKQATQMFNTHIFPCTKPRCSTHTSSLVQNPDVQHRNHTTLGLVPTPNTSKSVHLVPVHIRKAQRNTMNYSSIHSKPPHYREVRGQLHATAALLAQRTEVPTKQGTG